MIHPDTQLKLVSPEVGQGIFATRFIPKGTIVYIKDKLELVFTPDDVRLDDPLYADLIEKFSYTEANGNKVLSWDIAKHVNHCCNCNIISTGYGFEIAIRDILPGEEITDEYGLFNSGWELELVCDKPGCRKKLAPDDIDKHYAEWDEKIKSALALLDKVDQPLLKYMDEETEKKMRLYLDTGTSYISVYSLKPPVNPKV
jgi:hypothetical protein